MIIIKVKIGAKQVIDKDIKHHIDIWLRYIEDNLNETVLSVVIPININSLPPRTKDLAYDILDIINKAQKMRNKLKTM